ncbi:MAG: hypothetical protein VKL39_16620 [Leptolyngbyaceae bacterium]|nr:hypothetical protein [Leptolyngbyaceae bacterium]
MKLDPAVGLLMMVFLVMVGATSMSAFWGYSLGRQALSGVTQPDIRRTSETVQRAEVQPSGADGQAEFKSEEEILAKVIARMSESSDATAVPGDQSDAGDQADEEAQPVSDTSAADAASDASLVTYQQQFPLSTQNNQVLMVVNSVQQQSNTVQVNVSLQNTGDRPVEFLYSLMDVLDDNGQPLSVSTDGLPQEIPPTGEIFQGVVTVPSVLIGRSDTLSFRLTDYPNQQVELQINDIPIRPAN